MTQRSSVLSHQYGHTLSCGSLSCHVAPIPDIPQGTRTIFLWSIVARVQHCPNRRFSSRQRSRSQNKISDFVFFGCLSLLCPK